MAVMAGVQKHQVKKYGEGDAAQININQAFGSKGSKKMAAPTVD